MYMLRLGADGAAAAGTAAGAAAGKGAGAADSMMAGAGACCRRCNALAARLAAETEGTMWLGCDTVLALSSAGFDAGSG